MLRHRRLTTAAQLAERLSVSERTIYRDIQDLGRSGVPILGEAGVGYRLDKNFDLPPMMFTVSEVQALVLGARMVASWGDEELKLAARSVLDKIEAVLPEAERHRIHETALFSLSFHVPEAVRDNVGELRRAIDACQKVTLEYRDKSGESSRRTVCPLGLYFWGNVWTLGAWCQLREDYRNFRLDRIASVTVGPESYERKSPITLADYIEAVTRE